MPQRGENPKLFPNKFDNRTPSAYNRVCALDSVPVVRVAIGPLRSPI